MPQLCSLAIAGAAIPLLLVSVFVWPMRRIGMNIRGEGYLLFGTQQMLNGQFPIRDFRSYDPARYAWCALFSRSGKVRFSTIRTAMAVVVFAALSLAGIALHWSGMNLFVIAAVLFAILLWLRPRFKQLDNFAAVLATLALFALFILPQPYGLITLGIAVGLITAIGHNHGLYAGASSLVVLAIAVLNGWLQINVASIGYLALGGLVGAIIVAVPFVVVPGFAKAFGERKIITVLKRGTTNLPKPLPWIWTRNPEVLKLHTRFTRTVLKTLFTAMPIAFAAGFAIPLLGLVENHEAAILSICASSTGFMTFHHTLSNAGRNHFSAPLINAILVVAVLTSAAFPVFVCVAGWLLFCGLCALLNWRDADAPYGYIRARKRLRQIEVLGEKLVVGPQMAAKTERIVEAARHWSKPGGAAIIAPLMPGLYTILDQRPAMYDVFSVYSASDAMQAAMVSEIKANDATFAIVSTNQPDNKPELEFLKNFDQVANVLAREWIELEPIAEYRLFAKRDAQRALSEQMYPLAECR